MDKFWITCFLSLPFHFPPTTIPISVEIQINDSKTVQYISKTVTFAIFLNSTPSTPTPMRGELNLNLIGKVNVSLQRSELLNCGKDTNLNDLRIVSVSPRSTLTATAERQQNRHVKCKG